MGWSDSVALVKELEQEENNQRKRKLMFALNKQRAEEQAQYNYEHQKGYCPHCFQLKPVMGGCPNCD